MDNIVALQAVVTATPPTGGPSSAELDAIDAEMPVILADIELLDAFILILDREPSELDMQRLRRANNRALRARRDLANTGPDRLSGDVA